MDDDLPETGAQAAAPEPKKSGVMGLILALLATSVVGAAGGALISMKQVETISEIAQQKANEEPPKAENALAWSEDSTVAPVEPVISNLSAPGDVWIRLETAIVYNREGVKDLARLKAQVAQDILGFVRTVALAELQGPSAFAHLRDDLNERIRFTTSNVVEELIIQSMVLQ